MSRKKKPEHANHERWLVSYADFITLLFAFFVVLYASSASDKNRMGALAAAIENGFQAMGTFHGQNMGPPIDASHASSGTAARSSQGAAQPDDLARMMRSHPDLGGQKGPSIAALRAELERLLAPEIQRKSVALREGPDGLVVSLRELGFYASGSAVLRDDALPTVKRLADLLRDKQCHVRIEGHTDDVPIHTSRFNSNWELSTTRATELVRLVIDTYKFPSENLSAAGFGQYHPVASNDSAEGRSLNRRVDLVILSNNHIFLGDEIGDSTTHPPEADKADSTPRR